LFNQATELFIQLLLDDHETLNYGESNENVFGTLQNYEQPSYKSINFESTCEIKNNFPPFGMEDTIFFLPIKAYLQMCLLMCIASEIMCMRIGGTLLRYRIFRNLCLYGNEM